MENTFSISVERRCVFQRPILETTAHALLQELQPPLFFWAQTSAFGGNVFCCPPPCAQICQAALPWDFFPWWEGMSALERGHGESRGNEREGPQPYLCCHKLTSDGRRT